MKKWWGEHASHLFRDRKPWRRRDAYGDRWGIWNLWGIPISPFGSWRYLHSSPTFDDYWLFLKQRKDWTYYSLSHKFRESR